VDVKQTTAVTMGHGRGVRHFFGQIGPTQPCSISEDCVADMLTKRLEREKLARFALIFFNNLRVDWRLNPNQLFPLRDHRWHPDLKLENPDQTPPDDKVVSPPDSMQILVRNSTGSTMPMVVPNKTSIANLKILIHNRAEMPVTEMRLLHNDGKQLQDRSTIQDSSVVDCSIITATLRLRGGKTNDESDDDEEFDDDEMPQLKPLENHESAL
jgi:hypothetical protein